MSVAPLTVEVVDDVASFDALRDRWNDAAEASTDLNVFLTWEWLRTWWRHFGEPQPDHRLHVVVVSDPDGMVAAAPLFRWQRRRGPLRVTALRQISHDAGDYGGILLVRRPDEAVRLLVDHLAAQVRAGVDLVVLSRLASDGTFLATLRPALARARVAAHEADLGDACPYTDLRDGYDLRRHLKKHKVRQRLRRLTEKHADTTFTYHSGDTLDEGLDRLVGVHRRRWEAHPDEEQGQLADPRHEAFLLDAVRALDTQDRVRLLTLTADDTTVAADLDFALGNHVWLFKGAFDPDYGEFSPGQLVTYRIFEDSIERGMAEIDFMRGDHPYKRRWTNAERRLVTVTLTRPGPRGRLAHSRYRAVRPSTG